MTRNMQVACLPADIGLGTLETRPAPFAASARAPLES
jgi:hypothetical protein